MPRRNRRLLVLAILGAALLILVPPCLFTPAGPRLAQGAGHLWQGLLSLPGLAWAREQMQAAELPQDEAPTASLQGSQGSDAVRTLIESGMALQQEGRLDEALDLYRQAVEEDGAYAPAHAALGMLYLQQGSGDDALRELEQAAELAPDNGYILAQLGWLYLQREEYDAAVATLERARAAEPDDAQIRSWLGVAYHYRSYADVESSVADLEKAVELDPQDASIRAGLAMAYMHRDRAQDRERAIQSLLKVVELDPSQTEPYYYLGQLYFTGEQRSEAIAAWRRYVELGQDEQQVEQVRTWLEALESGQEPAVGNP